MSRTSRFLAPIVLGLAFSQTALADQDPRTLPVFDASWKVIDVLLAAKTQKKGLTFVLSNGQTYTGTVKAVGDHAVIVTNLRGKEFFDAYILLDRIVALEERVRLR